MQRTVRGLVRWQADGTADPGLDPELAAEALGSMVDQICYVWMNLGREFDEDALLDVLTTVWSRTVGVAQARPRPVAAPTCAPPTRRPPAAPRPCRRR